MKKLLAIIGAVISTIYLINPTAGMFELVPDVIPFIGNIDEAAVTALLIGCLKVVGFDPLSIFGSKKEEDEDVIDVE